MKTTLIPMLFIACQVNGQISDCDTTTVRRLDEVTVVASNQRADSEKTVYLPSNRQRSAASGGISLLARMSIPQLDVNPLSETVKTADNQDVSLFINFHAASADDVAGLNPQSVKRVEYYDFPTDSRFLRSQHAVNFVTKEIVFGGYTKLSAKEHLFISEGDGSLYSKFCYKAMEYDVMVNGDYDNNSHTGIQAVELYRLHDGVVERAVNTLDGKHREHNVSAGVRVSWNNKEKFSVRNLLSYKSNHVPHDDTYGFVELSDMKGPESQSSSSSHTYRQVGWESDVFAALDRGWSFSNSIRAEYNDNRTESTYLVSGSALFNNARERGWSVHENVQINKMFTDKFSIFSNIITGGGQTTIDYTGSSRAVNGFSQFFGGVSAGMALSLNKVSGSIDGGFALESGAINGKRVNDNYPFTHINLRYAPNQKNSLGLWCQYAAFSPDALMKNPNTIQQNELLFITGNPDLRVSKHISTNISYTFLPRNEWQLTAYAVMFRIMNRQVPLYVPDGPGGLMLKKYYNDGDYNHGQIGARLTGKFFNGKLVASMAPRLLFYRTTGTNRLSHYPFFISGNVDCYLGPLFFNLYFSSANSYVDGETCYLRKMPGEYSVSAGWSGKGWNVMLSAVNIFRSSWELSHDRFQSRWFDSDVIQFGTGYHRRISLTVSYTINYGRKVSADDELRVDGGGTSSILK